jgi:putative ABC transport system substrate-binding protein
MSSPAGGETDVIGFLRAGSPRSADFEAFRQGLRELGYLEGRSVVIELRHAAGEVVRLADLAADLARSRVDVIV